MLLLFLVGLLLLALIVPAVITGFKQLVDSAPALVDRLAGWLRPLGIDISTDNLITELQRNADSIISTAQNIAGARDPRRGELDPRAVCSRSRRSGCSRSTSSPTDRGCGGSSCRGCGRIARSTCLFVLEQAIEQTGGYFYSRLLLAVINGTGMYIVLRLNNVPFAAPLAIFEGVVAEFIPIVGTYIGGAVPILVAFLTSTPARASGRSAT